MAGYLVGAADKDSALELLSAIPDLDDARLRGAKAGWLHDLYPSRDSNREWIGQLQPDLIAEQLTVNVLGRHRALIASLLHSRDSEQAARVLTVLARAARTQPPALDIMRAALDTDPAVTVAPALTVAITTNPAIAALISETTARSALPRHQLQDIAQSIPYRTVALAEVASQLSASLAATAAEPADKARWRLTESNRLADLGRREEALAAIEEAVRIRRELAQARPDVFLPDLAMSLKVYAYMLNLNQRVDEAAAARAEAGRILSRSGG